MRERAPNSPIMKHCALHFEAPQIYTPFKFREETRSLRSSVTFHNATLGGCRPLHHFNFPEKFGIETEFVCRWVAFYNATMRALLFGTLQATASQNAASRLSPPPNMAPTVPSSSCLACPLGVTIDANQCLSPPQNSARTLPPSFFSLAYLQKQSKQSIKMSIYINLSPQLFTTINGKSKYLERSALCFHYRESIV